MSRSVSGSQPELAKTNKENKVEKSVGQEGFPVCLGNLVDVVIYKCVFIRVRIQVRGPHQCTDFLSKCIFAFILSVESEGETLNATTLALLTGA